MTTVQSVFAEWRETPSYPAHWISGGVEQMLKDTISEKTKLTASDLKWLSKALETLAVAQRKGPAAVEEAARALMEKAPAGARGRRSYPGESFMPEMEGDFAELWDSRRGRK